MATVFGQLQEFDKDKEEWSQYAERLEYFFVANEVESHDRKKAILLSAMGPACYKLLRNLVAPAKPVDKTYKELVDTLKDNHEPRPSEIVQRCKFNSRVRQPGESVSTFVSQLGRTLQLRAGAAGYAQRPFGVRDQQPSHAAVAIGEEGPDVRDGFIIGPEFGSSGEERADAAGSSRGHYSDTDRGVNRQQDGDGRQDEAFAAGQ